MKIFIEDSVAYAPELTDDERLATKLGNVFKNYIGWTRGLLAGGRHIFADSSVPEAVWWILQNTPATITKLTKEDGAHISIRDLFEHEIVGKTEDRIYDDSMAQYSGKLINYLMMCLDRSFYELWIDTWFHRHATTGIVDSVKPKIFVRPKPFDFKFEVNSDKTKPQYTANGITVDKAALGTNKTNYEEKPCPTKKIDLPCWEKLSYPDLGSYSDTLIISEDEIISKNIGVSDYEVMSLFYCFANRDPIAVSQAGRFGHYYPLLDADMIREYGLRDLRSESRFIPPPLDFNAENTSNLTTEDTDHLAPTKKKASRKEVLADIDSHDQKTVNKTKNSIFMVTDKRDKLWRMNRYNHIMESGTITIVGRDIRVGSVVFLKDEYSRGIISDESRNIKANKGMHFYATGVSHSYAFGRVFTTTLALTRGHNYEIIKKYHDSNKYGNGTKDNNIFVASYE